MCILWHSCENTVLVTSSCYLYLQKTVYDFDINWQNALYLDKPRGSAQEINSTLSWEAHQLSCIDWDTVSTCSLHSLVFQPWQHQGVFCFLHLRVWINRIPAVCHNMKLWIWFSLHPQDWNSLVTGSLTTLGNDKVRITRNNKHIPCQIWDTCNNFQFIIFPL